MTGYQSKRAAALDKPLTKEHGFMNYAHLLMVKCFNEKCDEHLEKNMTGYQSKKATALDKLAQPVQEPCGWQFLQDGKWHNGTDVNDHRANTIAVGFPVRDVYPAPPAAQPAQEPVEEWFGQSNIESLYNACQHRGYCKQLKAQQPLPMQPEQDVDYWIREATAARQAEMAMRRELEAQPVQEPDALTIVYQSGYHDGKQAALAGREWNFCERCGKRTADLTVIHTCTPPQDVA